MIMKLYIPTTTLNFNNILSSETISPKVFYERRGYGYRRWENIPENSLENGILLYKEPFSFTRPDNGLDDYPMLVELDMNEDGIEKLEKCDDWGYKSSHSLTLTPVTARFIFFSERHKRIALSKSETSAETKLTRLYGYRFSVCSFPECLRKDDVSDFEKLDGESLEVDRRLNKIKGFAYGYIIGRMLSRTKIGVEKLNAIYNVRDVVASIMSSGEGKATGEQREMLGNALLMFDGFYIYLLKMFDKNVADKVYLDFEKPSFGYTSKRKERLSYILNSLPVREKWNEVQKWITGEIVKGEAECEADYNIFNADGQSEIAVMYGKLTAINSNLKYIDEYKMLVNEVFTLGEYNGKVSTFRLKLAEAVTDCVIDEYGDKWESSEIRTYLNAMRHYVAGEQFTQPWTDGVLSSITAVIMKGEDWEGLFRFMVSKGMCDYRYAFGLYGALNGFANLTRDFTDILFASDNKQYVWNVYKEIHRQLTGVALSTMVLEEHIPLSTAIVESQINNSEAEENNDTICKDDIFWLKEHDISFTSKVKLEALNNACIEAHGDRVKLLNILIERNLSKTKCEKILRKLEPSNDGSRKVFKRKRTKSVEQSLFDAMNELQSENNNAESFDYYHIESVLHSIKSAFPNYNSNTIYYLRRDLQWALSPKYSKSLTTEDLINKFCNGLHEGKTKRESRKGRDMSKINEAYKNVDVKAVHDFLIDRYCK